MFVRTLLICGLFASSITAAEPKWNIVLIGTEDISPDLGCYAHPDAITPNLDKLASQGARFTRAFSHAPVCAPTRSGIITGMYPTTLGSHHMRSTLLQPPETFTEMLQKAGYEVHWPGKTDFNFAVKPKMFTSTRDWMKNPPKEPFLGYINFLGTHESQIRAPQAAYQKNTAQLTAAQRHDPAKVKLPPYYPDTPIVRKDVAHYHDNITAMDYKVGEVLAWLDEHKLAERTVVIFFGDHGWGMPRGKRWCYDSGLQVPLLIRWPGVIAPGTVREDLVKFLDIAPTALSIAGANIPERLQGRVIVGKQTQPEPKYVFAARDRMDETFDRIRSVRDRRFRYVKNFYPELPYAQHLLYMNLMPTMQEWRRLAAAGKLDPVQSLFFAAKKPTEELYDTATDPYEVKNLASDPAYADKLKELRTALEAWIVETKDLGATPEPELIRKKLVADRLTVEYADRLKEHPKDSKARSVAPDVKFPE